MTLCALSAKERRVLEQVVMTTDEAQILRRAQALLWLDQGERATEVAERLYVSRSVVYKWVKQFQEQPGVDIWAGVSDAPRSGRPRTAQSVIEVLIDEVIDGDPRDLGYRSTVWTAPLLVQYLAEAHHLTVSTQSVRLALKRLRIGWKRPRHSLSRRSRTWRQAKGGSNVGSGSECER